MAENIEANGTVVPTTAEDGSNGVGTGDKSALIYDAPPSGDASNFSASPTASLESRNEISPLQMDGLDASQSRRKTQEGLKIIIISSVMFAVSVTVALILTIFLGPPAVPPHGAVACDSQECADIGLQTLKDGGSAVDAAIATIMCMGVVNPHHSGIGGGNFMLIRQHKSNQSTVINAREEAPAGVNVEAYGGDRGLLRRGVLAVAVPGELRGLELAHNKHGKLPWRDLIIPAAKLARDGFNVSGSLAHAIAVNISADDAADAALRSLFYREGAPLVEGAVLTMPGLADVLDDLAENGVEGFYSGKYGQEIIKATQGSISEADLNGYKAKEMDTLKKQFRNMTVETMPAPGGGPLLLFILHVLQNYTLSPANQSQPLFYHRFLETVKFAQAEKYRLGDPDIVSGVQNATDLITSLEYAASIRAKIQDKKTFDPGYYLSEVGVNTEDFGTAHVSVIGPNEDFVSATSTINMYFGSHVVTDSGIILNNEMADFDIPNSAQAKPDNVRNYPEPGKRPLSSMAPTFVHKFGKPCAARIAVGGINGSRIVAGVAEVLLNVLAFQQNISDAIEEPRIYATLDPEVVEYDEFFDKDILTYLQSVGHKIMQRDDGGINLVHGVAKINETVMAHADSREVGSGAASY